MSLAFVESLERPSIATEINLNPQHRKLLALFRSRRRLTPVEASVHTGCAALSARICELRKAGYNIKTRRRPGLVEYHFEGE